MAEVLAGGLVAEVEDDSLRMAFRSPMFQWILSDEPTPSVFLEPL